MFLSLLHVVSTGLYPDWRIQDGVSHMLRTLVLAFGLGAPSHGFSHVVSFPTGLPSPHGLFLAVEPGLPYVPAQGSKKVKIEAARSLLDLGPELTQTHFCSSLLIIWSNPKSNPDSVRGEMNSISWWEEQQVCAAPGDIVGSQLCRQFVHSKQDSWVIGMMAHVSAWICCKYYMTSFWNVS